MGFLELFIIAIGLSMDAVAASICKGLSMKSINYKAAFLIALSFGVFQAIMPLLGWYLGSTIVGNNYQFSYEIAFFILVGLGIKVIIEAVKRKEQDDRCTFQLDYKEILLLSFATSIDALAIGVYLSLIQIRNMTEPTLVIGSTTFILSFIAVIIGHKVGYQFNKEAEIAGGIILIGMGIKILFTA